MKLKLCHTESLPSVARTESSSSDDDFTASITSTSSATLSPYCPSKQMQSSACIHANTSDDVSTEFYSKQSTVAPHTGFKKVLVTGGAGFVGSNVAEQLLARGDSVVIVDEMSVVEIYCARKPVDMNGNVGFLSLIKNCLRKKIYTQK